MFDERNSTAHDQALARRTGLPLKFFKCGWFDEKNYFEFFPLKAVYPSKPVPVARETWAARPSLRLHGGGIKWKSETPGHNFAPSV